MHGIANVVFNSILPTVAQLLIQHADWSQASWRTFVNAVLTLPDPSAEDVSHRKVEAHRALH